MAAPLPVSVRVGSQPPAFIVDAAFALSPMGLLATMALARAAPVWLPRGLLTLLDNDRAYRQAPEMMGGAWLHPDDRPAELRAMTQELQSWQRAWHYGRLAAQVHWIGDARHESALADRNDAGLLPRFELCAAALERRLEPLHQGFGGPLDECVRDALALAAALQPDPVFLVAPLQPGARPQVIVMLERMGFRVLQRASCAARSALLGEAALGAMAAADDGVALIQLAAPAVLALPESWDDPDWAGDDTVFAAGDDGLDVWRNACALWQPLGEGQLQ